MFLLILADADHYRKLYKLRNKVSTQINIKTPSIEVAVIQ